MTAIIERLGLTIPLIQAPMAGTATPALAAAVSEAGGLGSIALGSSTTAQAQTLLGATQAATQRPINVNVFAHTPTTNGPASEAAWLAALAPNFQQYGTTPPTTLRAIYQSFNDNPDLLALLLNAAPAVVSFQFGLPDQQALQALRQAGSLLFATATSLAEGHAAEQAGIDAVVAQGYEAGGHRGIFDLSGPDDCLPTFSLTRLLVRELSIPVIAAGGIMDGAGIAAVCTLGAVAAQLGTAFVACPESAANDGYRAALLNAANTGTTMTTAISGRPARCLRNRFTAFGEAPDTPPSPGYPTTYDAGKALHAAASAHGEQGYGAHWAGQGAPLARSLPARELVALLAAEYQAARQ